MSLAPRQDSGRTLVRIRNQRPDVRRVISDCRQSGSDSAEQLFDAADQPLDGKRFDQVLHVMLGEEEGDVRVGREAGNEDEPVCEGRPHLLRLEIKLITAQMRHL